MSMITVGAVLCWLLSSLFAGWFGVTRLAPIPPASFAWGRPPVRFAAAFIFWPFALFLIASFAVFVLVFFWDLLLFESWSREESPA